MKKIFIILSAMIILNSCENGENKYDAYGNFEADAVLISSEAAGKLMIFDIEEGSEVQAGVAIGYVDSMQLHLQKQQLFAKIYSIKSRYGNIIASINTMSEQERIAMVDKDRLEKLFGKNAATQKQLDDINGRLSVINKQKNEINSQNNNVIGEIKSIEAQIEQVNDQIRRCAIINPIDGTILNKYAERFEITSPGKPLYKIADLKNITLRVYASGSQLPHIKLGQKVKVFIDDTKESDRELSGEIYHIASNVEFTPKIIQTKEERVNMVYAVKIRVKNDGSLKIGMPGAVRF